MTISRRRRVYFVALHVAIALAFSRFLVDTLVDRKEMGATDFTVFYTGWSLVLSDPAHTYDVEAQRLVQSQILGDRQFLGGVMTFYYPPHVAVALAPFAALRFETSIRLWLLLQLGAAIVLGRWLLEASQLADRLDRLVLATALAGFLPLLYALQIGQYSIAMVLALLGFWRAFDRGRDLQAGLWLLALTVKPQLLPVPLLLLLATRRFRPLLSAVAGGLPLALLATAVLGRSVWLAYPGYVHELEGYVAGGSHDHMLNLRGALTALAGPGHDGAILTASAVVFVAAAAVVYLLLRRQVRDRRIGAAAFATALALLSPVNPHLHLQDALIWALPLTFFVAELGVETDDGRRFALFALGWPVTFVFSHALELVGRQPPIAPPILLALALAGWAARRQLSAPLR